MLLARAAELLEAREFDAAEDLLAGLQTLPMSRAQSHTFKYRQAQLAHFRGDHQLAAGLLRILEDTPELRAELRGELLLTLADSLQALGRAAGAVEALLRRDKIDLQDSLSTHMRILDLVDSLDPLNLLLLRENAPDAEGWIALSEVLKSPPAERRAAARRWRAYYPRPPGDARAAPPPGSAERGRRRAALPPHRDAPPAHFQLRRRGARVLRGLHARACRKHRGDPPRSEFARHRRRPVHRAAVFAKRHRRRRGLFGGARSGGARSARCWKRARRKCRRF